MGGLPLLRRRWLDQPAAPELPAPRHPEQIERFSRDRRVVVGCRRLLRPQTDQRWAAMNHASPLSSYRQWRLCCLRWSLPRVAAKPRLAPPPLALWLAQDLSGDAPHPERARAPHADSPESTADPPRPLQLCHSECARGSNAVYQKSLFKLPAQYFPAALLGACRNRDPRAVPAGLPPTRLVCMSVGPRGRHRQPGSQDTSWDTRRRPGPSRHAPARIQQQSAGISDRG